MQYMYHVQSYVREREWRAAQKFVYSGARDMRGEGAEGTS